jgi:hypothetical protein
MTTLRPIILGAALTFALPSAQALAADGWGASWSFGPVHPTATNHIIHTKTTLVSGRLPSGRERWFRCRRPGRDGTCQRLRRRRRGWRGLERLRAPSQQATVRGEATVRTTAGTSRDAGSFPSNCFEEDTCALIRIC